MASYSPLCGWVFKRAGAALPPPIFRFDEASGAYVNSFGCQCLQLPSTFPALRPLYADFELNFNSLQYVQWAADFWWVPLVVCAAYLLLALRVGPALMANLTRVECKNAWAVWNLLLAVFSLVGFLRTFPHLVYYGAQHGYYESVCAPAETAFGQGAAGLWTMLFIFSKVPELIDTVFLVIQKKEVIFLHWYHHFTVLLYCWHSYATRSSAGLYFVAMNYGVHAMMYFYYFLTSCGYKPWWNKVLTTLQISQMFVGMIVCLSVAYFKYSLRRDCDNTGENLVAGFIMYGSYFWLFAQFFFGKYTPPAKKNETLEAPRAASEQARAPTPKAAPAPRAPTPKAAPAPRALSPKASMEPPEDFDEPKGRRGKSSSVAEPPAAKKRGKPSRA